jgi:HK97 family phage portal protein
MGIIANLQKRASFFGSRFFNHNTGVGSESVRIVESKSADPFLADFFGLSGAGGVAQGEAAGLAVAQACVSAISQTLSSVPLSLYRRLPSGGVSKAVDHPLYSVLHDAANDGLTAFELREFLIASILITGNGYAKVEWNAKGQVTALHPLQPHSVAVERLSSGRLRYLVSDWNRSSTRAYTQDEILHVRYRLGRSGFVGQSPIDASAGTFAMGLALQNSAGLLAEKGGRPEGVLQVQTGKLNEAISETVMEKLRQKIERGGTTGGILILDGESKWSPLAFSSKDSELLESRKLSNLDIARVFGVPPSVVGITDNATYSNIQGETQAFVSRALAPMAKRIESAMCQQLLPELSRQSLYAEHDLQGLLRGDLATRYDAYGKAHNNGWMNANEIRALENMPKIEGGDAFLRPLNMVPTNTNAPVIA